jgi:hypothetical protein
MLGCHHCALSSANAVASRYLIAQLPRDNQGDARAGVLIVAQQHKPVAPEEQSQRLDDRSLTAIGRADEYGVAAQRNVRRTHTAEAGYL